MIIVTAVALALAVDGAWSFWQNCAIRGRLEKARTGTVSWNTVGVCFREGAFAIAGGRIGKYLEQTKHIRNGAQVIERVLRETVPESQLHALLNSKNFSTTAGALGDIIEKVARGLYNLLRR